MKRLGTGQIVAHAQTLARLDASSIEYREKAQAIESTCRPDDYQRILNIEAGRRRRDAGIIDGRIVQSFQGSFKKG